jgi:GntR family transcriptional regulator/MocR family aminotransferase
VRCQAEQVVITTGARQAFGLAAATLAPKGSGIWVEDPGYEDAWAAFSRSGLQLLHQAVDEHGLVVPRSRPTAAKLAYLTPSRQFPLGVTMSLDRRLEWLSFAAENNLWLIEDDYDSEFRYQGRPLPSLQGLVPDARVMYIGTFSKALYPSLRIAYAVVPAGTLEAFANAKYIADGRTPAIDQAVAAEFLREGHFVRHLRKMRTIYGERINVLQEAAQEHWRDHVEIRSTAAGLGVVGFLRPEAVDTDYAAVAAEAGYHVSALSTYAHQAKVPPGLVLGFAAYSAAAIRRAVRELAAAWNTDPRTRK